ncbi:MAG: CAP domain-containing protein, partial [Lachnospiraceae bacterium]|nr:CAP domain-containing protein [Lachnospiraceae bacterium]
ISAMTMFAVATATAFSVPAGASAEEFEIAETTETTEITETTEESIETEEFIESCESNEGITITDIAEYAEYHEANYEIGCDVTADTEVVGATADIYTVEYDVTFCQTECRNMLTLVNKLRTGSDAWYWNDDNKTKTECTGLSELTYDYQLEKVAMQRAVENAIYYSHTRPNGGVCWDAYGDLGYSWWGVGENIAVGYASANAVYVGWEEADKNYSGQGHRRNMLNGNFNRIGIAGVYYNNRWYWAMELATSTSPIVYTEPNNSKTTVSAQIADSMIIDMSLTSSVQMISLEERENTELPGVNCWISTGTWNRGSVVRPSMQYTIADTSVAEIRGDKIYALKAGSTQLTITALGKTCVMEVTVYSSQPAITTDVDGYRLAVLDGIAADLYIQLHSTADDVGYATLEVSTKASDGTKLNVKTYSGSKFTKISELSSGLITYRAEYDVSITDISRTINVTLKYKGDEVYNFDFSVADYLYTVIGDNTVSQDTKKLCKALLNYGTAVQKYFGIDTNNLANSKLDAASKTIAPMDTQTISIYHNGNIEAAAGYELIQEIQGIGTSLILDNIGTLKLRYYFTLDESYDGDLMVFVGNDIGYTDLEYCCYVDVPVNLGKLNNSEIGLLGFSGGQFKTNTVYLSVYGYMNAAYRQSDANEKLLELLAALYELDKCFAN